MEQRFEVPLHFILDNPYQPRTTDNADHIKSLALSIAADGLLQVPTARELNDGTYELAFGHSRRKAFEWLNQNWETEGLPNRHEGYWKMPINVEALTDEDMYRQAVSENVQRKDLDPIELAKSMTVYRDLFGKNSDEIGALFGMNGATVRGKLRLLDLPDSTQIKLASGEISEGVGRSLLTLQKLMPSKLEEVTKEIIKGEDTPQEIIGWALSRNDDQVEQMWSENRSGKALAGYNLWPLDMKRFPNNLLPLLTGHVAVQALDCFNDKESQKLVLEFADYLDADTAPDNSADKDIDQEFHKANKNQMQIRVDRLKEVNPEHGKRLELLINPPACTACDFYAKVDGDHYCGLKACWSRKVEAWRSHLMINASKKLGFPIYDEKVDGDKYILQWDDKHYFHKGVDLRLMPKPERSHIYQGGLEGVPEGAQVVLVGKTLEKKRKEDQKERQQKTAERREEQDFVRLEKQRDALLWEASEYFLSIFESVHDGVMDALMDWRTQAGTYRMKLAPSDADEDTRRVIVLNVIHHAVDAEDAKNGVKLAEAMQSLSKAWKVKLPKDWIKRMTALGVSTETADAT